MRTADFSQCFAHVLVAMFAGLSATMADASPPSLEEQAETEFAQAGVAVRARLEQEASGDSIGARVAAHEAELHRYRYLDLQRALKRLHPGPQASPSVAAARNPFIPDGFFLANLPPRPSRGAMKTPDARDAGTDASYHSWDMYRPRLSVKGGGTQEVESSPGMGATPVATGMAQGKDMYATELAKPALTDQRALARVPEAPVLSADTPRQPFLVYRAGLASSPR